jgi:Ca2+:H+ antiporter
MVQKAGVALPLVGLVLVVATWGSNPSVFFSVVLFAVHVALVLTAVAHAEAIAHRLGEPFGTLALAVAITVIEVALIVTLMGADGPKAETLARDTVFAAIMIVCNGVVGVSIFLDARRDHVVRFSEQGANALLGTVITIATLSLVMPTFTSSSEGGTFTGSQLAFSAVAAASVYGVFIFVQTVRHRWMFLAPDGLEQERSHHSEESQAENSGLMSSLVFRTGVLLVSLVGVVGLAKTLAPRMEDAVSWLGAPQSFVGVMTALLILLPESVTAFRAASNGEMQRSLNLSLGSALASIGLTIPAVAIASIWMSGPITLGLGGKEIVLLALTAVISSLTFGSGQATILQGAQHLAVFAAFIFLSIVP